MSAAGTTANTAAGGLAVESVYTAYDKADVLEDVTLEARPG